MRLFLLLFISISFNTTIFCQDLIDIKSNNYSYRFPKIIYKKSLVIEEKINDYLQLKHLNHLPGDYKKNPFEIVINKKKTKPIIKYLSFKNRKLNRNILCIQLNGIRKNKPFEFLEHFDLRTGDYFSLMDLFNSEGQKKLDQRYQIKFKNWLIKKKSLLQNTNQVFLINY